MAGYVLGLWGPGAGRIMAGYVLGLRGLVQGGLWFDTP